MARSLEEIERQRRHTVNYLSESKVGRRTFALVRHFARSNEIFKEPNGSLPRGSNVGGALEYYSFDVYGSLFNTTTSTTTHYHCMHYSREAPQGFSNICTLVRE